MQQKGDDNAGSGIQSVVVTFEILEELSKSPAAIGVSELARRLGQTKARVHRHLATLRTLGLVSQDEVSDRYQLGWKIYRLGMSVAENFGLRRLAHRHMQRLAEDSGQTSVLAMPANADDVIVVDTVQSNDQVAITIRPGAVIPAASSALWRVILAFEPEEVQAAALALPISRLTEETLSDRELVERQLGTIKTQWFEFAANQRRPGVAALAAPVFDDRERIVASVGVIGSERDLSEPPDPRLIRQVQEAARRISDELGSAAWQRR